MAGRWRWSFPHVWCWIQSEFWRIVRQLKMLRIWNQTRGERFKTGSKLEVSGYTQLIDPPLVFTRSDFGGGQILGPPQAKIFGVFWAFLRGKRFKNGTILVQKSDDPRDWPPLVFGQIGREGGGSISWICPDYMSWFSERDQVCCQSPRHCGAN